MRRTIGSCVLALSVVTATAAWAGESSKCTMNTQECLNEMADKMKGHGWVGLEIDKREKGDGYIIQGVVAGSPAAGADIRVGDVLYALNGIVINEANKDALKKTRQDWLPGQKVSYTIQRDNTDHDVQITLAPVPADVMARWVGEHMLQHAAIVMAEEEASKK